MGKGDRKTAKGKRALYTVSFNSCTISQSEDQSFDSESLVQKLERDKQKYEKWSQRPYQCRHFLGYALHDALPTRQPR